MKACPPSPAHSMTSSPPSSPTRTGLSQSPRRIAATAEAVAPVPHAIVMPEPRSQTRIRIDPRSFTVTNSTFTRSGKIGSRSIRGPASAGSVPSASSTKMTQ